ncbi:hypothetical protein EMCRGX_G001959 [Ephydatia muelleri]
MSSHIDEKRYSVLVDYLTSCKEGDLRESFWSYSKRETENTPASCYIGQTYWWKGLNRDLDQYCRRCDVCQWVNAKVEGKKAELHPIPVPSKVWSQIGIDQIDYFSKWPEGAPLKDKTAVGVADFLFTVFCRHGWPDIIISEQGREFVNQLSSCLFKLTGIEHKISSSYHPQTKGLDERTNQTLTRALIKFSEAKENWDENIDAALYAYRIAKQDSSQFSPFFIMYNRTPCIAINHEFSCKTTTNVTDSEQRNWPRDVLESKDGKDAKRAYREGFTTEDGLLFKTKRRKKGLTSVQEEERYRVVTVDEKVRLLDTVHKDPAGGHFGVHKTQEKVAERYYWKGMASDIANYCSTCLVCQRQNKIPCNIPGHWFLAVMKSGFFDVYIQGKRDGVFSSINPTELKSLFRKWPIINCEVVDAVQHFLYGIAIDEGYGGNRANILAWDVLYPELMISIISKSKEMNYEEAELYYVDKPFELKAWIIIEP